MVGVSLKMLLSVVVEIQTRRRLGAMNQSVEINRQEEKEDRDQIAMRESRMQADKQ